MAGSHRGAHRAVGRLKRIPGALVKNARTAENYALVLSAGIFSILAVVVRPGLEGHAPATHVVEVVIGGVSLALLFTLLRYLFNSIWAHRFAGDWMYEARILYDSKATAGSTPPPPRTPHAIGRLSLGIDGSLSFEATLYANLEDTVQAYYGLDSNTAPNPIGSLASRMTSYQDGELSVAYELTYTHPYFSSRYSQDRNGSLKVKLEVTQQRRRLIGTWSSSTTRGHLAAGSIHMWPPGAEAVVAVAGSTTDDSARPEDVSETRDGESSPAPKRATPPRRRTRKAARSVPRRSRRGAQPTPGR
jgi:hypothetical protein